MLDKTILIHAPPETVFGWLAPARQPAWDKSILRAATRRAEPLHAGTIFDRITRSLGYRFESAAEAIAVETDRLFAWRQVAGDYEAHEGAFTLERVAGGDTRVHVVADVELPFVLPRLATEAEVREAISSAFDDALFNLKAIVESRP